MSLPSIKIVPLHHYSTKRNLTFYNCWYYSAVDDIPPVISGCDDFGTTIGLNIGGAVVTYTEPTATDNSGVVSLQSRSRAPGQFFVVGSTPVTYVFVDGSGNTAECTFNVIVTEGMTF